MHSQFIQYTPCFPLDRVVEQIWYREGPAQASKTLPGGTLDLVVNLTETPSQIAKASQPAKMIDVSQVSISGVYERYYFKKSRQYNKSLGIHFLPGAAQAILKLPLSEFRNNHRCAADIDALRANSLRNRLLAIESPSLQMKMVESWLIRRLTQDPAQRYFQQFLRSLTVNTDVGSVASLVDKSGYSQRQINRLCHRFLGMNLKTYTRLQRFKQISRLLKKHKGNWATLALNAGYYDQSHMLRDFSQFAGTSPSDYLRQNSGHPLHLNN